MSRSCTGESSCAPGAIASRVSVVCISGNRTTSTSRTPGQSWSGSGGCRSCARRVDPTARQSARPAAPEHPVLEGPPRDESELLRADAQRHLGVAAHAVGERDRHLRDVVAVLPDAVTELDLEAVTLGARMRVVDRLECVGAKRAVPGRCIANRYSEHEGGVTVSPFRDRAPVPRPVRYRPAGNVTGADGGVGAV